MKVCLTFTLALMLLFHVSAVAQVENNIVITDAVDNYVLVPDKLGQRIESVKHSVTNRFMATRAPGNAIDHVRYNDFIKVNKASVKAKGVKPVYGSAYSSGIFYDDSKVCAVSVPLKEINKPVETRFELTNTRPDLEPLIFLGDMYPIRRGVITFTMPIAFKDRIDIATSNTGDNITIQRETSQNGRDWIITITATDLPALEQEKNAPPSRHINPSVQLIGQFADVDELYTRLRSFTLQPDPAPETVKAKALEITSRCNSDLERAEAIFHWVTANIRYVAIEHGDLGNIPDHASEVLRKRYGDCKGSANLIKTMLRDVGLDGRLVWIGTNTIPDDFTDRPVYASGNHMIAALKLPGDSTVYLDGTVGLADYGLYSDGIQGQQTLIENGEHCIIGRVPVQVPQINSDCSALELHVENNMLKGQLHRTVSGGFKAALLNQMHMANPHEHDKLLKNFMTRAHTSWNVTLPSHDNMQPGNGCSRLTSDIVINRQLRTAGNKTYITVEAPVTLSNLLFDTKDRKHGGWLDWRRHTHQTVRIALPQGDFTTTIPSSTSVDNDWISANVNYEISGQTVTASFTLTVKELFIPRDKLDDFNRDIQTIIKATNSAITLTHSPTPAI